MTELPQERLTQIVAELIHQGQNLLDDLIANQAKWAKEMEENSRFHILPFGLSEFNRRYYKWLGDTYALHDLKSKDSIATNLTAGIVDRVYEVRVIDGVPQEADTIKTKINGKIKDLTKLIKLLGAESADNPLPIKLIARWNRKESTIYLGIYEIVLPPSPRIEFFVADRAFKYGRNKPIDINDLTRDVYQLLNHEWDWETKSLASQEKDRKSVRDAAGRINDKISTDLNYPFELLKKASTTIRRTR